MKSYCMQCLLAQHTDCLQNPESEECRIIPIYSEGS